MRLRTERGHPRLLPAALLCLPCAVLTPQSAKAKVETVVAAVGEGENRTVEVDIRLLNESAEASATNLPTRLEGTLEVDGAHLPVQLILSSDQPAPQMIPAQGFGRARYRLTLPDAIHPEADIVLAVESWDAPRVSFRRATAKPATAMLASHEGDRVAGPSPVDRELGNAFLDNLSAYEPVYAVYGPGTSTAGRVQFSFKYQLFGSHARETGASSLIDGLYFAYTQRMFWDLRGDSSPFHNIDFQPELFYASPTIAWGDTVTASAQIGLRHESNGRDGTASRSVNSLYVAPAASVTLPRDWSLTIRPRLWLYVGDLSDNPDIRRYRGNTGLAVEIGQEDGLRLSTSTRFNIKSGKGAFGADISYPLSRIIGGGPDFYLFGQSYIGYGENLLDYNRRATRVRIGLALVR